MQSLVVVVVSAAVVSVVCAQQWSQQSSQQQPSPYPRIKIGGPLGQLIPNGIQLGSGLGSLMNQLIGSAEQQQTPSSPYQALSPPNQHFSPQFSPQKTFNSQLIPQNFFPSEGLFGSASSPLGLATGPYGGHSSQLGSTNSELFSHSALSSQLFD